MRHEGKDAGDSVRNVVADICAAAAAQARTAAVRVSEPAPGADPGVALQAWLAAATTAGQRPPIGADAVPASPDCPGSPLTRSAAVLAQEKALQAAMVAHAVAGGTASAADAAAHEAEVAEAEVAEAEGAEAGGRRSEAFMRDQPEMGHLASRDADR